MPDPLYSMAMLTGFLGSGHCLGMCGGIVAALSLSKPGQQGGWPFHLLYNLGRITTYTGIGLLVGYLGSLMAYSAGFERFSRLLLLGSDLFIIVLGLATAGAFSRLNFMKLEFASSARLLGGPVARLNRLPPWLAALPLGLLFGFLPCGMVYAMAITAAQTASPGRAGVIMLAFGLGTVPALFSFASAAQWLGQKARAWMLRGAGLTVAAMGLINLYRHLQAFGVLPGGTTGCFC
ncbi:MAG: sulfite exporter TauE/SafE family protein [Desulfobulbaceae bacterium]|nr:sulfite exporter TauE/SafE family protein [Desulfobulbaceae bacterium]